MQFDQLPVLYMEMIGVAGFVLYVTTYSLLTMRVVSGDSIYYFILNLGASSMVMVGLMASFNLASALIQAFWITMSVIGITMRLWRNTPKTAEPL